jgi:hypothetical protein
MLFYGVARSELTGSMWDFAGKKGKTNIAFQSGRTTTASRNLLKKTGRSHVLADGPQRAGTRI